jgi:hypothetical protein
MPALVFPNITAETMGWKIEEKAATRGVGGSLRQQVTTDENYVFERRHLYTKNWLCYFKKKERN